MIVTVTMTDGPGHGGHSDCLQPEPASLRCHGLESDSDSLRAGHRDRHGDSEAAAAAAVTTVTR